MTGSRPSRPVGPIRRAVASSQAPSVSAYMAAAVDARQRGHAVVTSDPGDMGHLDPDLRLIATCIPTLEFYGDWST